MAWTGFCILIGALAYKNKLHIPVFQFIGIHQETRGPLKIEGSILEFDQKLLSSMEPIHRFNAETEKDWKIWRGKLINDLKKILKMDSMPKNFEPIPKVVERIPVDGLIREKILLTTEPGLNIPLYLFIPKIKREKIPAIVVFHGHGLGKIETAGVTPSYQNSIALELAKSGFVTLTADNRGFGELGWSGKSEDVIHHKDIIINMMMGRTTLGTFLYDAQKLVDYLYMRKEVDQTKIGAAGISLGGVLAIWSAALDSRINGVVCSGTFGSPSLKTTTENMLKIPKGMPIDFRLLPEYTEFQVPGIFKHADVTDIAGLIAPRPLLFDIDANDKPNYKEIFHKIDKVYKVSQAPDRLSIHLHHNGHTFSVKPTIQWFQKWLNPKQKV